MTKELPPALEAEYKWLKRQLDQAQDDRFKVDANRGAEINFQKARADLSAFVSMRRKEGFNI